MKKLSSHYGVALITVMLVVALAAILATQMTAKLQLQLQRSINIESNQQAYWYAMGAEAFSKRVLVMSFDGEEDVTYLGQLWAQGENSYPIDYGDITGEITDLQSCFNLNALRNTEQASESSGETSSTSTTKGKNASEALERLMLALDIDGVSDFEIKDMVDALTDWLDTNDIITNNGGAEDNDYSSREYPYLTANHFLGSVKELRTVEHFTLNIIDQLKPYVCVIPNSNFHKINVNTVAEHNAALIAAVLDITDEVADAIISERGDEGYQKIEDVFDLQQVSALSLSDEVKELITVDSDYFLLKTKTTFNDSYFFLNSIMKVEENNQINIISRTIGRD